MGGYEEQRKGYARSIIQAVEVLIKGKGCPKINLQIRTTNEAVVAFYTAIGYGNDNVVGLGNHPAGC